MRRLPVLAALLALMLLAAPVAAFAEATASTEAIVLAVEGEPSGPDPAPRTAEDNAARELAGYEDRELPFHWGAAWLLAFAGFVGLVLMGGLYQLLVRGPEQKRTS